MCRPPDAAHRHNSIGRICSIVLVINTGALLQIVVIYEYNVLVDGIRLAEGCRHLLHSLEVAAPLTRTPTPRCHFVLLTSQLRTENAPSSSCPCRYRCGDFLSSSGVPSQNARHTDLETRAESETEAQGARPLPSLASPLSSPASRKSAVSSSSGTNPRSSPIVLSVRPCAVPEAPPRRLPDARTRPMMCESRVTAVDGCHHRERQSRGAE